MTSWIRIPTSIWRALALGAGALALVAACGGGGPGGSGAAKPTGPAESGAVAQSVGAGGATPVESSGPGASEAPAGSGATSGDIPDTAVFLTYADATHGFSIQYVEGWQVTPSTEGVTIRDKDRSVTVRLVSPQTNVAGYVARTDLPALRGQVGFAFGSQDTVTTPSGTYVHVSYQVPAPPDPVTGKQVPTTVDRYYVPGPKGLAIVNLATPTGVDNVDAFRQIIESFRWT